MGHTTTVVRLPGSDSDRRDTVSISTTRESGSVKRVTTRLRGVDHEADLASALDSWRPLGGLDGEGPRFVLGGRLGQGSQGVVFALRDRDAQRVVALKTLNGRDIDQEDVSRFLHEVQVTAQLEHPGVVPVHDVGVLPDGTVFYTMKRVEGVVLCDWLAGRAGSPSHRFEVIQLFLKICDTMAFAHSRGVLHRDLKPRNIMVGMYGEVLVMDWGLAKVVGTAEPRRQNTSEVQLSSMADHETLAGTAVGTPAYMSPEQARGQLDLVDHRSDIYGLGVILYEMLAAASPYFRGDLRRTVNQVVGGQWTPIDEQSTCRELPRRLIAIVHKAMAHLQEARYQHVGELTADLRSFLAGEAVTAYRETPVDLLARIVHRHRRAIAQGILGVLVVLAVSGAAWWQQQAREDDKVEALRAEAAQAVADGKWAEARLASEAILVFRPDDRETRDAATRFDERVKGDAERLTRETTQVENNRRLHARAAQLRQQATLAAAHGGLEGLAEAASLAKQAQALHAEDPGLAADYERWFTALSALRAQREQAARTEAEERQRRDSAAAFAVKASEAEQVGNLDAAIGALSSAIELVPDPLKVERLGVLAAQRLAKLATKERELREQEQRSARDGRRIEADVQLCEAAAALAAGLAVAAQGCLERAAALVPDHPDLGEARVRVENGLRVTRERAAEVLLAEAGRAGESVSSLQAACAARQEEIRRLRGELGESGDPARRAVLAAAEDADASAERDRAAHLAECIGLLNRALALAPSHAPVRTALAAFWVERLRESEEAGNSAAAAAAEAQAVAFDDGAHRDLLAGLAWVANHGRAALRLIPITRQGDRTEAPAGTPVELAAGGRVQLLHGRYLAESVDGVRLAIVIERGSNHDLALPTPPVGLAAGEVFVPGGRVRDETGRPLDRIAPFVVMDREVTCGAWLTFVNDPAVGAQIDESMARGLLILVPRDSAYDGKPRWRRRSSFVSRGSGWLLERKDGRSDPDCPLSGVSYEDAVAYAGWLARRDGKAWRLPTVTEWQFAVQGGDKRAYPWGSADDMLLCASGSALARDLSLAGAPGARHPADRSVQGVWDLAGSLSEFCASAGTANPELRAVLGGSLMERQSERFTAWSRRDVDRRLVSPSWGLRLVYTP